MYYVLHSKNDIILARLATDLELMGVRNDLSWNDFFNPYNDCFWVKIFGEIETFNFHTHECVDPTGKHGKWFGRFTVTGKNYNKVLKTIYEALKEKNERH